MSDERLYHVVSEDGDAIQMRAVSPQAAVDAAIDEWSLEAELGYRLHVFDSADAKDFKICQHAEPDAAQGTSA